MSHQDGVIEAARTIDSSLSNNSNDRGAGITEVNNYLTQNPTFVSNSDRATALSQQMASRGDLPDTLIAEFSKSASDRANDPLAQLLSGQASFLGSNEADIQKNVKALAEGQAARETLRAFTPDQWNAIFPDGAAGHDDVKTALKDTSLNLTADQTKALTDLDANFSHLQFSGWHFWNNPHQVTLDRLQADLDVKNNGIRGKELASVDALQTQAQSTLADGTVNVNIESGEGWQNVAAKALGYDVRLRTQADWQAVPQTDINKIYGLANYFAQQNTSMLKPGQLQLQVPDQFQTS